MQHVEKCQLTYLNIAEPFTERSTEDMKEDKK